MKTCIKMTNDNVYIVEGQTVLEVIATLIAEVFVIIPGTEGREDFAINSLQVSAVYPARTNA